ncbi:permease [cyanobacterium endosymbiont of Epithemia clementina EcSB]|uniref:permease n=1 Tax=cyanobacterium endosymbiont of Epithemia clementina EcSB TaxID=3034674 RepID=UPI002480E8B1|nr:permease [cyanobacterium endosymbiont of Epithemia clementina EcSB]WGT67795.1 permease [cyanobacterium endosymbiont of Epithemia clementina EcSB]
MGQLYNAFTLFLSLLIEAFPFLLLGVLLSSSLLLLIDKEKLIETLPKNPFLGALAGSCIGFLFPVCECGNVPVARRLLMQGIPTSAAISFLLAAPTINPVVVWSTWVAFRAQPEIVVFRIVFSLTIAVIMGCVFSVEKDSRPLLQPFLAQRVTRLRHQTSKRNLLTQEGFRQDGPTLLQSGTFLLDKPGRPLSIEGMAASAIPLSTNLTPNSNQRLKLVLDNVIQELRELGGMLILGSAIAACLQVFVPREIILNLGRGTISSIIAMMLLAAIVSICSTVDSFFALSFASTFTTSSLLAFLVFGPMIDIKAIGLMLSIFKPRMLIYLFVLIAQLTFILALYHSYFF